MDIEEDWFSTGPLSFRQVLALPRAGDRRPVTVAPVVYVYSAVLADRPRRCAEDLNRQSQPKSELRVRKSLLHAAVIERVVIESEDYDGAIAVAGAHRSCHIKTPVLLL